MAGETSRHRVGHPAGRLLTGFLLSSLVYQLGYPIISDRPDWAWRLMLWAGVLPAIFIFFLMTRVSESPMWLEQQRQRAGKRVRLSIGRMFDRDLLPGHGPHVAADGRVRVDVSVDDDLYRDYCPLSAIRGRWRSCYC